MAVPCCAAPAAWRIRWWTISPISSPRTPSRWPGRAVREPPPPRRAPSRKFAGRVGFAYDSRMHLERRRSERDRRVCGRVPVVCAVRNTIAGRLYLGQAEDIGPGGITLRRPCDLAVQPQTPITLTFDLPGLRRTLDLDGLVISDRRMGSFRRTGVRFLRPSDEQAALLGDWCARLTAVGLVSFRRGDSRAPSASPEGGS